MIYYPCNGFDFSVNSYYIVKKIKFFVSWTISDFGILCHTKSHNK